MRNYSIYKSILVLSFAFFSLTSFAVNRTWTGAINNDFNNVGNWTGGGALSPIDNFTITVTNSPNIFLSANITINDLTYTCNDGVGVNLARLDVVSFVLTINGTAIFNPVQYFNASNRDEVQIDAGSGGIIFNGPVTFQTTGNGDTYITADVASQGYLEFHSTVTLGAWAYTTPTAEPDFIYDAVGAQSVSYNSNNFVVPRSMIFGLVNSPTVTYGGTGTTTNFSTYDGPLTVNNSSIADIGAFDCDNFTLDPAAIITVNNGSELRVGGDSDFPAFYSSRVIGSTSTVTYNGTLNQNVTAFTYGNIGFDGAGTKTSLGNFSILGNWTNNVTFAHGNDSHTFSGTPDQTIGGTSTTTFYNLIENKATGKILLGINTIVANVLTLTNGPFDLNAFNLSVTNNATAAIVRTNGYVISERSDMTSTLTRRVTTSAGNKVFPFGTVDGTYIPFTYARVGSNNGNVTVATYPTAANNTPYAPTVTHMMGVTLPDVSDGAVDRFWQIDVSGTVNANFTFTYSDTEVPALGEVNLRAQRWNGLGWDASNVNITSQSSNAGANTVTANGVSAASPWTLAIDAQPLPVELLNFDVAPKQGDVLVSWITASEENSDYFTVERSKNGIDFEEIKIVEGSGNSNITLNYSFLDEHPYNGVSYYRLKQTDLNGASVYFETKSVTISTIEEFSVYPNPVTSQMYISLNSNSDKSDVAIKIHDIQGSLIMENSIVLGNGVNEIPFQMESFAQGMYFVTVKYGGEIQTIKFTKK